jgi:hypothetical protein
VADRDSTLRHRDDGHGRRGDDATIHPSMPRRRDSTYPSWGEQKRPAGARSTSIPSARGSRMARNENDSSNATRAFVFSAIRVGVSCHDGFVVVVVPQPGHLVWLH